MTTLNMTTLYARTGLLLDVATRSAVFLSRNDELTPQGRLARLNEYATRYGWADAADGIRQAVAAARAAAEGWTTAAVAEHMPTADTDAAQVAAELAAARLLARGEGGELAADLLKLPASPGRTIALEELQARGAVTRATIAAQLPGVAATRQRTRHLAAALAEIEAAVAQYTDLLEGTRTAQAVTYRSLLPVYLERGVVDEHLDVAAAVNLPQPRMPEGVQAAVPSQVHSTMADLDKQLGAQDALEARSH